MNVLTGGTDVHLVLVDLRESELDGQQAEDRLHDIGITVNRNAVPYDPRPPAVSSGLRIGTPGARHPRPAGRRLPRDRARSSAEALTGDWTDERRAELSERTRALAERYPLYPQLSAHAARRRRSLSDLFELEGVSASRGGARVLDGVDAATIEPRRDRAARPVRLREVDAAAAAQPAGRSRRGPVRFKGEDVRALDVLELRRRARARAAAAGAAARAPWPTTSATGRRCAAARPTSTRCLELRRARRRATPTARPAAAVGGRAAARDARARARARAGGAAARRAHLGARRGRARRARADAGASSRERGVVDRARHPRPRPGASGWREASSCGRGGWSRERRSTSRSGEVAASLVLVAIAVAVSRWRRAELEDDIAVAVLRSFVQLTAVGYVIQAIFDSDSLLAGRRAARRDGRLRRRSPRAGARRACRARSWPLALALARRGGHDARRLCSRSGVFDAKPRYLVPVGGMVIGNAMTAAAVALNRLADEVGGSRGRDRGDAVARRDRAPGRRGAGHAQPALGHDPADRLRRRRPGIVFFPGAMVGHARGAAPSRSTPCGCS